MGACVSTEGKAEKERSLAIDKQIEEDSRRFRKECKILLLGQLLAPPGSCRIHSYTFGIGSGESGKSTIVKQMKIIHQNGYTSDELAVFRLVVYKNLVDSAKDIVLAMKKVGVDCVEGINRVCWISVRTGAALGRLGEPVPPADSDSALLFEDRRGAASSYSLVDLARLTPALGHSAHDVIRP